MSDQDLFHFPVKQKTIACLIFIFLQGPILIVQKFLPLLKQAATISKAFGCSKAGVVMMSSRVGSQQIVFDDEPGASLSLHYK